MRIAAPLALTFGLLVAGAITASLALADNGPHGNFGNAADPCAICHRAHTGSGSSIVDDGPNGLCLTCHDGSGANTDVYDGLDLGVSNRGLRAGGFTVARMDTEWTQAATPEPITSSHTFDGGSGTAWGNGDSGSGAGASSFSLSCVTCHDPHGEAGAGGSPTYRLLRPIPPGSGAATGIDVPDEDPKTYSVSDASNRYFGESYGAQQDSLSQWCALCHTRYLATSGSATTDSGDGIFAYRHMTDGPAACTPCHEAHDPLLPPNPLGVSADFIHAPRCQTCHVAHGSTAAMGAKSGAVEWPDGSTSPAGNGRSSLLRLDSRGVCNACHAK